MRPLTNEDWAEIHRALWERRDHLLNNDYRSDDADHPLDDAAYARWLQQLQGILDTIGPDGRHMWTEERTPPVPTTPPIQVGTIAIAAHRSGVCDVGERGVCYEVYDSGGVRGYGFIFEQGRHEGFSPCEVEMFLRVTDEVCAPVADYRFQNVPRLQRDFDQGRFAPAFTPR